jgi:hypothetical protein
MIESFGKNSNQDHIIKRFSGRSTQRFAYLTLPTNYPKALSLPAFRFFYIVAFMSRYGFFIIFFARLYLSYVLLASI